MTAPSRIAVIEDEEHLAQGLLFNLEAEGYRTHLESDGDAALAFLLAAPTTGPDKISVIVLDCMLPGTDGFAIARALREAQRYTPILMLTARARSEDILEGLEAGAVGVFGVAVDRPQGIHILCPGRGDKKQK